MNVNAHKQYRLLDPVTTVDHVEELCQHAKMHSIASVCMPPLFVKQAKEFLAGSAIKVSTIIGYPYGYNIVEAKLAEIIMAMVDGCDEMEVHINLTALKNADWQYLARELSSIAPVVLKKEKLLTVVVNNVFLTDDEMVKCCDLYGVAGINFFCLVANDEDTAALQKRVKTLRAWLADSAKIKIAGPLWNDEQVNELVQAGADIVSIPFTVK